MTVAVAGSRYGLKGIFATRVGPCWKRASPTRPSREANALGTLRRCGQRFHQFGARCVGKVIPAGMGTGYGEG